jgi:flagellar M-ring protein FliF
MDQIKKLLAHLSLRQKLSIAACAILVAAFLAGFAQWRRESDFRPIYTALAAEDAGAVVQKLKETGTEFRLSENGATVLVPSARLAELRLQMALSGLPKSGRMGFEIFDKANFGATDFTEHVNYRRALEGELERSIASLAEVERARVHLTFSKESLYLETRQPAKASVVLGLRPGAQLSPQNVAAVCHLLASAVEGLAPEAVSVVDTRGNLLSRPRKPSGNDGLESSEANLEYREKIEKDLLAKIQSTLEPLLGAERFRAAVSAECDFTSGEQSEETFDPSRSVMISSQKSQDIAPAALTGGVPGTASNLPRPPARPAGTATGASRRTEEINYQSSRLLRRVRLPQGDLKRVSVSLLVDQDVRWEGKPPNLKQVLIPPTPEKLRAIRDLVAGVISFKAERGDQLVVETLPFEATLRSEPPAAPPAAGPAPAAPATPHARWWLQPRILIAGAGLAAVLAALAAFGRRFHRRRASAEMPAALPPGSKDAPALAEADSMEKKIEAQLAGQAQMQARLEAEALEAIRMPSVGTNKTDVLTKYLRESLKKDPVSQVQTLRTWLNEKA